MSSGTTEHWQQLVWRFKLQDDPQGHFVADPTLEGYGTELATAGLSTAPCQHHHVYSGQAQ